MTMTMSRAVTALASIRASQADMVPGLLDIKHMNDLVAAYRHEIRELLAGYRHTQSQKIITLDAGRDALLVRRQIADIWMLYRMAQTDSRNWTRDYMRRLPRGN